jgi:hypothetical protein
MICPKCGYKIPVEEFHEDWPPEAKVSLRDSIVTDTDLEKMLMEADKAKLYMRIS